MCAHGSGFASRERRAGHKTIRNEFRQIDAAAASNDSRAKHLSEPNRTEPEPNTEPNPRCTTGWTKRKNIPPPPPPVPSPSPQRSTAVTAVACVVFLPPPALSPLSISLSSSTCRLLVPTTLPTRRRPRRRIIDLTRRRAVIVNSDPSSSRARLCRKKEKKEKGNHAAASFTLLMSPEAKFRTTYSRDYPRRQPFRSTTSREFIPEVPITCTR